MLKKFILKVINSSEGAYIDMKISKLLEKSLKAIG